MQIGIKRILGEKLSFKYWGGYGKFACFKWTDPWTFGTYWSGRMFTLTMGKIQIDLDCRKNWIEDMITGEPK